MGANKSKRKKSKKKGIKILIFVAALALLAVIAIFLNRFFEMRTYELAYADIICENADSYSLDRYLVAAVIHTESGSRADAVSPAGARGLMQIMPETGGWIAEKLKFENFSEDALFEPETSISFGCWYLDYLLNRYDGNETNALAAYNAGQGNVDKWLADPRYADDGELKEIPYPETKAYVKRVLSAKGIYMELYEKELG